MNVFVPRYGHYLIMTRTELQEPTTMDQLQAMRVFLCAADLASFGLAAQRLGISVAAVSRSVGLLEAHLNVKLLSRSTRVISLTESGGKYLEECRSIIRRLDEMESSLVRATREIAGTLRIATSTTFALCGLSPMLAAYQAAFPSVSIDVTSFDTPISMTDGGFHVGFAVGRGLPDSSLVSREIATFPDVVVASPAYLAKHGTPLHPSELVNHALLAVSHDCARRWEFLDTHGLFFVPTGNALQATSAATIRVATLDGMGIALLPAPLVSDDLASGRLLSILEPFCNAAVNNKLSITYPGRIYLSTKVRHFIDFAVNHHRPHDHAVESRVAA